MASVESFVIFPAERNVILLFSCVTTTLPSSPFSCFSCCATKAWAVSLHNKESCATPSETSLMRAFTVLILSSRPAKAEPTLVCDLSVTLPSLSIFDKLYCSPLKFLPSKDTAPPKRFDKSSVMA